MTFVTVLAHINFCSSLSTFVFCQYLEIYQQENLIIGHFSSHTITPPTHLLDLSPVSSDLILIVTLVATLGWSN